jgi:hypothetical protein
MINEFPAGTAAVVVSTARVVVDDEVADATRPTDPIDCGGGTVVVVVGGTVVVVVGGTVVVVGGTVVVVVGGTVVVVVGGTVVVVGGTVVVVGGTVVVVVVVVDTTTREKPLEERPPLSVTVTVRGYVPAFE